MQFLNFFFIGALTILLYCCGLCQSYCKVLTENEEFLQNYLINTTDENYTISAFCKCTAGKYTRWWQLNSEGQYKKVPEEYLVDTVNSTVMIQNYTVTKSSVLLCGNVYGDYARAISIVIEEPQEECISSSSNDTIKQSPTVIQQSFSSLSPFIQSSTISDDIVSSSSSSRSHEDSCSSMTVTTATKWRTKTVYIEASTTLRPGVSTSQQPITTESISVGAGVGAGVGASVGAGFGAGVIVIVLVVIIVLLALLVVVIKRKYKVDDESRKQGPSGAPPLELPVLITVNPIADHQLDQLDTLNHQHYSPSSTHEDEQ